jgi:FMN reductase
MSEQPGAHGLHILGIGGTTRPGSTTERALRMALGVAAAAGAETELLIGSAIDLPLYAPEKTERSAEAQLLVTRTEERRVG